jgi:hypothetical protein
MLKRSEFVKILRISKNLNDNNFYEAMGFLRFATISNPNHLALLEVAHTYSENFRNTSKPIALFACQNPSNYYRTLNPSMEIIGSSLPRESFAVLNDFVRR